MFAVCLALALFSFAAAGHVPQVAIAHAPVYSKQIHHVPVVNPVHHVQKTIVPVHHPPVTTLHQQHTSVLAQAPKLSGYAYQSDVRHDAAVHAAPIAVAAPIVSHAGIAAAPVAAGIGLAGGYAGGYAGGLGLANGLGGAGLGGVALAGGVGLGGAGYGGHGVVVSAPTIHAAPAVVKETPAVSSYTYETGRTHVATQAHYGVAHIPAVQQVHGVKTVATPVAVHHAAPVVHHAAPIVHGGYGGHY